MTRATNPAYSKPHLEAYNAMIDHLKYYNFGGLAFARAAAGEFDRWFESETIRQIDDILEGDAPAVDIGGRKKNPLQLRAVFDDYNQAQQLEQKEGTVATLSKTTTTDPRSASALLSRAKQVFIGRGLFAVDCTFDYVSG